MKNSYIYSTYLGGGNDDGSIGIDVDSDGNAYVTGYTHSSDFPTQNPYDSSLGGDRDAFVASYLSDGSLPVELSLLTATVSNDGVILMWRTETEIGNVGFNIYRSASPAADKDLDGEFQKVGWVEDAGNSAMPTEYQFPDKTAQPGHTYFYYIEDVDITGTKDKSKIIQVTFPLKGKLPSTTALLQNYPNPFNPDTWIPFS